MIIKAQKKPIIVEAIEYTGDNKREIIDFTNGLAQKKLIDDFYNNK